MLLDRMAKGQLRTDQFVTHLLPLDEAPHGYDLFKHKKDGCVRAVFQPGAQPEDDRASGERGNQ
jgi:threonine dehydrogenase-like Zn-dependent dehydrogenase